GPHGGRGEPAASRRSLVSELVSFEKQGSVGVITVNNPPVNALAQGVRQGLIEGLARGIDDPGVSAMVIIGGGRTFIAGADIREFGKPPQPPDLHSVLEKIESSPKPVVAAIHGTRSEEHTSELQSRGHLVCRLLLEKKKKHECLPDQR